MNNRQQRQYLRDFNGAYGMQYNVAAGVKGLLKDIRGQTEGGHYKDRRDRVRNAAVLEGLQGGMYMTRNPGANSTPGRKGKASGSQKFARYIDHQVGLIGTTPSRADNRRSKQLFGNATNTAIAAAENTEAFKTLDGLASNPFSQCQVLKCSGGGGTSLGFSPSDALGRVGDALNSADRWVMDHKVNVLKGTALVAGSAAVAGAVVGASPALIGGALAVSGAASIAAQALDPAPCRGERVGLAVMTAGIGGGATWLGLKMVDDFAPVLALQGMAFQAMSFVSPGC